MEIRPFKALRFDAATVSDVGSCITPPYDIIDGAEQQMLYDKSAYNIVRITRGKTADGDNPTDNQYTRAAEIFNRWLGEGVFKADPAETIYVYIQNFTIGSRSYQRGGFVALGKLEEFGKAVRPHEKTLEAPKADRLRLLQATAAQFGQVFMLYDDPQKTADNIIAKAAKTEPLIDFTYDDGVRHRLFSLTSQQDIQTLQDLMAQKDVIIADGHHRYETALNYYKLTKNPAAQYRMMTFVNIHNEGLIIFPTHRLVGGLPNFDNDKLVASLRACFEITQFPFKDSRTKQAAKRKMLSLMRRTYKNGKCAFGIYTASGCFCVAVLKDFSVMESVGNLASPALRTLDVSVLHKLVLEKLLGITENSIAAENNIQYINDIGNAVDESIAKVDNRERQAAFFMNPSKIEQVQSVAAEGQRMPQKSTYFYPKLFTGLTIYKIES